MSGTLPRLLALCAPERAAIRRGVVATAVASLLQAVPAVLAALAVRRLVDGQLTTGHALAAALVCGGALALRFAVARYANGILYVVGYQAGGRVRHELLERLRHRPDLSGGASGRGLTVLTHDAGLLGGFVAWSLPVLLAGAVLPVAVVLALVVVQPVLAVVAAVVAGLGVVVLRVALRRAVAVTVHRRDLRGAATARLLEHVRGIDVVRAHGLASERESVLAAALTAVRDSDSSSVRALTPVYSGFQAVVDAGMALMVLAVAGLLSAADPDPGDLAAALLLTVVLLRPQLEMGAQSLHLPQLAEALDRIEDVLREPLPPSLPPVAVAVTAQGGVDVTLAGLAAGYGPGPDVLSRFDLVARAGRVTALVGPSGAGKTTVLQLVAGLLEPRAGSVCLGGADLARMGPEQSAALVTAVFQDSGILRGRVDDALRAGDPSLSRERMEAAAVAARIHDRVQALPGGYAHVLGEEGAGLSGGERQRLAIARALCTAAPVVLLDEATSALDATNERLLREALAALVRGRTLIVVAHRLETIRSADHIAFLDDGCVVEQGTHEELLALDGRYAASWQSRSAAAGWSLARPGRARGVVD